MAFCLKNPIWPRRLERFQDLAQSAFSTPKRAYNTLRQPQPLETGYSIISLLGQRIAKPHKTFRCESWPLLCWRLGLRVQGRADSASFWIHPKCMQGSGGCQKQKAASLCFCIHLALCLDDAGLDLKPACRDAGNTSWQGLVPEPLKPCPDDANLDSTSACSDQGTQQLAAGKLLLLNFCAIS